MLTLHDAVRIEEYLKRSFADVVINGSQEAPIVKARSWLHFPSPIPCQHKRLVKATNVNAIIENGCLSSGRKQDTEPIRYDEIVYCSRPSCLHVEKATIQH